ncbi:MAG: TMEM165/GDT1 family protein [Kaiparowitsia implicata GSE-PSE-MK54-09C]|nr:TMEM165/GDT1 family protein [Kaiparowitsia implicata GSE-PSE-MK54-09C]
MTSSSQESRLDSNLSAISTDEAATPVPTSLGLTDLDSLDSTVSESLAHTDEQPLSRRAEVSIFLSTFATVFLAEIGDKTQFTVLLMSAESGSPWTVFSGAATALVATSLCGVLLGRWLSTRIAPAVLERAAGGLLLSIAALLLLDVVRH